VAQDKLELENKKVRQNNKGEYVTGALKDGTKVCIREFSAV
jgi:hypothetical protein